MISNDSLTVTSARAEHVQFHVRDLLVLVSATAMLLLVIRAGHELRNIWLIQSGILLIGAAFWLPLIRQLSLVRFHWMCVFACWWVPMSWFCTYAIWQSAFGPDFWIPQIMAIGDVGYYLSRFMVLPLFLIVATIGGIDALNGKRWGATARTLFGITPPITLAGMEAFGLIKW